MVRVHIVTSGSIASDHLMTFPGRFAESFVADHLDNISVSFLASDLQVRRGGVAANISYGLAQLQHPSTLLGAVGEDFAQYEAGYAAAAPAVNLTQLLRVQDTHTARFTCTTDTDQAQIATFYPGAMSAAKEQRLAELHAHTPIDLVVISPNDPDAMRAQTDECRDLGIDFVADPSQQVTFMDGPMLEHLITGAKYLFSNHHEAELIRQRTGWSDADIMARVAVHVVTHGKSGSEVTTAAGEHFHTGVVSPLQVVDPTGGGDAFRSGFLAGLSWGCALPLCAELGAVVAAHAVSTTGPQGYHIEPEAFLTMLQAAFSADSADQVRPRLLG